MQLRLNLGCGPLPLNGFLNLDLAPGSAADMFCNALSTPFRNGIAIELNAHHRIEHFTSAVVPRALDEWVRLLAPGGQINISFPDIWIMTKSLMNGTLSTALWLYKAFTWSTIPGITPPAEARSYHNPMECVEAAKAEMEKGIGALKFIAWCDAAFYSYVPFDPTWWNVHKSPHCEESVREELARRGLRITASHHTPPYLAVVRAVKPE